MVGQETLGPFRSVLLQNELNQPKHVNLHTSPGLSRAGFGYCQIRSVFDCELAYPIHKNLIPHGEHLTRRFARWVEVHLACPLEHLRQPLHCVSVNAY